MTSSTRAAGWLRRLKCHPALLGLALPIATLWVHYFPILNNWWTYDDLDILHYIDSIGPVAGFYQPELKYNFYTPLQHLSLGIDYLLFGFDPFWFYLHHLILFTAILLTAYLLLRRYFSILETSLVLILFVVLVPTVEVLSFLMVRHYLEGLLFSLLSLIFFIIAVERSAWRFALIAAFFYGVATLAKEIYVPLLFAAVVLPQGEWRQRLTYAIPMVVIASVYTLVRFYMLGEQVLSGYAGQSTELGDIMSFPAALLDAFHWQEWWQLSVMGLLALLFLSSLLRGGSLWIWRSCVLLSLVVLPLVPIINRLTEFSYYLLLPGLLIAVLFGVVSHHVLIAITGKWKYAAVFGLFAMVLAANWFPMSNHLQTLQSQAEAKKEIETAILNHDSANSTIIYDSYVADDLVFFHGRLSGLNEVNENANELNWCPRADCLCAQSYSGQTALHHDGADWIETLLPDASCSLPGRTRSLDITITATMPTTLSWEFRPYGAAEGNYFIAATQNEFDEQLQAPRILSLPPQGEVSFCCQPFASVFEWTINYRSIVEPWEIISEPITIDMRGAKAGESKQFSWSSGRN